MFLRGAGGVAVALPWLEFFNRTPVRAQSATAQRPSRYLTVFTPGGTVLNKWRPTGTETAPVLSPILAPLEPVKNRLLILDGIDMKSAVGGIHECGSVAMLTGTPQSNANRRFASGPSIDQVLADRFMKPRRSLEIAIRWATGKGHGLLATNNCINFENAMGYKPIPPRLDPVQIWNDLFKAQNGGQSNDAAARLVRRRSVLDFLDRRYATLAQQLGVEDRAKLEQHLTKIREIERGLEQVPVQTATCKAPALVDTSDYKPTAGLKSADDGSLKDRTTDAAIPKVGKLMIDMMVMAFACDMTGVGTLQWSDTEAKHTFPWLNLSEHHHFYQHDGGFKPAECQKICTWYSEMHLYLLQAMERVDMGGHTLLDESVVLFGSELQDPPSHKTNNTPFMLAGGGGLRTGRWLRYNAVSHNNLLLAILNLFGDERRTFGDPAYCTGPLTNLT